MSSPTMAFLALIVPVAQPPGGGGGGGTPPGFWGGGNVPMPTPPIASVERRRHRKGLINQLPGGELAAFLQDSYRGQMLILGTLGDLVKKICELETTARMPSRETAVQMSTYHKLLEEWPVENKLRTAFLIRRFKLTVVRFKEVEQEMERQIIATTSVKFNIEDASSMLVALIVTRSYCNLKKQLREIYNELNTQGSHLGLPPFTMKGQYESGRNNEEAEPDFSSGIQA